ncbi:DUF1236 domain-containing protein [Aquabacter cavernae]|uniref:DUF1236 domain-containing protein n=1 Tax=Aquabacter cavernae TaxID=2496029 RepID=UPI000F8CA9E0|nr:DUF1236 domain-containing protein [Aquabacter cavernae]
MTVIRTGALGAIALTLAATVAAAQTTSVIVAKPSGYVLVNPEQEVLVQRYVVGQPTTTTVTLPSGYAPTVGSVVPGTVELNTFGTAADYGGFDAPSYRYVVTPDYGTVLVEPGSRRVIQIIR